MGRSLRAPPPLPPSPLPLTGRGGAALLRAGGEGGGARRGLEAAEPRPRCGEREEVGGGGRAGRAFVAPPRKRPPAPTPGTAAESPAALPPVLGRRASASPPARSRPPSAPAAMATLPVSARPPARPRWDPPPEGAGLEAGAAPPRALLGRAAGGTGRGAESCGCPSSPPRPLGWPLARPRLRSALGAARSPRLSEGSPLGETQAQAAPNLRGGPERTEGGPQGGIMESAFASREERTPRAPGPRQ